MEWHVLIATPHQVQREQLCTLYSTCPLVAHIDKATNKKELRDILEHTSLDLVVVHQSLITDIALLPANHFVIIAAEPNTEICNAAYRRGTRGYFLDDPLPVNMLLAALDPARASQKSEFPTKVALPSVQEVLTPCQLRVFELREKGLSYEEIAERLCVSLHTVKNHLENAYRRLRDHGLAVK